MGRAVSPRLISKLDELARWTERSALSRRTASLKQAGAESAPPNLAYVQFLHPRDLPLSAIDPLWMLVDRLSDTQLGVLCHTEPPLTQYTVS